MPKYIEADKIIYSWVIDSDGEEHDGVTLQSIIRKMPAADVRENIHGMWIIDEDGNLECSVCGHHGVGDLYCERCGARMDERDEE